MTGSRDTVAAAQAALGAEHAAVYGYGVVGGRLTGSRRQRARSALAAHRARRDAMVRAVRGLGARPEAAAAAYRLPFPVRTAEDAARLAVHVEERVAAVYADLVAHASGGLRRTGAEALRESAVRAVAWRGGSTPFPGLPRGGAGAAPTPTRRADG